MRHVRSLCSGARLPTERGRCTRVPGPPVHRQHAARRRRIIALLPGGGVTDGFGDMNCYSLNTLIEFDEYLYAGTTSWDPNTQSYTGGRILRCAVSTGCNNPSDWHFVAPPFYAPENYAVKTLIDYDGYLYAGVGNYVTGMEIWRTTNSTEWEQVGFAGFGDSNNYSTYYDNSAILFNNHLYFGTINWANGGEAWLYLPYSIHLPLIVRK